MARLLYQLLWILIYPFYEIFSLSGYAKNKAGLFYRTRKDSIYKLNRFYRALQHENYNGKIFWLHAASAGELDQIRAIIREIKKSRQSIKIIVSIFSLSVKNIDRIECDLAIYLPLDFPWKWQSLDRDFTVDVFATSTWDVFPNLLAVLKKRNAKCYLVNAALGSNASRLKHRWFFKNHYRDLTAIYAVDEENANRFKSLFDGPVEACGDSRYDTVMHRLKSATLDQSKKKTFETHRNVWILASTYSACDEIIFPFLKEWLQRFDWELWIFSHHLDEQRLVKVESEINSVGFESVRMTDFIKSGNKYTKKTRPRIWIIDEMGLLAFAYSFADFCYVGGAFHNRVHNTAEPAGAGLPVVTGPIIDPSPVAVTLESIGALFRCPSEAELKEIVFKLTENSTFREKAGKTALQFLKKNQGAAKKLFQKMNLE